LEWAEQKIPLFYASVSNRVDNGNHHSVIGKKYGVNLNKRRDNGTDVSAVSPFFLLELAELQESLRGNTDKQRNS